MGGILSTVLENIKDACTCSGLITVGAARNTL